MMLEGSEVFEGDNEQREVQAGLYIHLESKLHLARAHSIMHH